MIDVPVYFVLHLFFQTFSAKEPLLLAQIDFTIDSTLYQGLGSGSALMDVLYEALGICALQFLIKKI